MRLRSLMLVLTVAAGCRPAATVASSPAAPAAVTIQPGVPGQAGRVLSAEQADALPQPKHTAADVAFMTGMIPHHEQALVMTALVAERTEARDVRLVAQRIALSQSDEITLMKTWLRQRGEPVPGEGAHAGHEMHAGHLMPGMLNAAELDTLRNSRGVEFEKHFLRYMIKHHEGAVAMVAQLFRSQGGGQQSEIYAFAADVDADQQMEIERMLRLLAARP
ncbi:MAG: DUF305 domain-containing protein [Gemmatimonadaceae bacterium]|nr:DUF305 domain-containing protein [Gemmatimonadaceae bacterium]MCW5826269.1 DUF305 domain-containing protein [Gemmatimonadaceae bacterium]